MKVFIGYFLNILMKFDKSSFLIKFKGRIDKKHFIKTFEMAMLILVIVTIIPIFAVILDTFNEGTPLILNLFIGLTMFIGFFYILYFFPLFFSLMIRRLHDIGKSGWYFLLVFIPLVNFFIILCLFINSGDKGSNKYGKPN